MNRGLSIASRGAHLGFGPAELMGQVNEWLKAPDLLTALGWLGGAAEGETDRIQLDACARSVVADVLREENALDQNSQALREKYGAEAVAALDSRGLNSASGRTLVRLEAQLSGREFAEVALDKAADPNQLALTRKEAQYRGLAQAGRFDLRDPQFSADRHFLPYEKIWSRLNPETQQAISEGQQHWNKVAGHWEQVLRGERPTGPEPVDWWGVRGIALQHVEQKAQAELAALRDELQGGKATAEGVGERLQRLDVYREALGEERFGALLKGMGSEGERMGEWFSFRDQFVEGKKRYWHKAITEGKEAADLWDAAHFQPLRERRDGALTDQLYGPLVQAIQAEALAVHQAYADLGQAKLGWWQARRTGQPTEQYAAQGAEAQERLKVLDPQAEGLWGTKALPWPVDQEQRKLWEQERAAEEARRQSSGRAAHNAAELRERFRKAGMKALIPYADLIWEASQRHGVQAEAIAAVIWQESKGDPNANAGRNAGKGLMQIEFGAHKAVIEGQTEEEKLTWIYKPKNNVEFGTTLLTQVLAKHYDGTEDGMKRALQYYNYGSGAARWVEARTKTDGRWQHWVQTYHDTHIYDKDAKRWREVASGGSYGDPTYGTKVIGHYHKLMSVQASPTASEDRRYDGMKPAKGTTNTDAWVKTEPPLTNRPGQRSPERYLDVVDQHAVAHNPRYEPRNGNTYCNIFVWDVTHAMGAEIPHWVGTGGAPSEQGKKGTRELNANGTLNWLIAHGQNYGWTEVSAEKAQELANKGRPAVATWHSGSGEPGHIAMVIPGEYDAQRGPAIAQAGGTNLNRATVREGFGKSRQERVRYFAHE